jgi:hypothetical protein
VRPLDRGVRDGEARDRAQRSGADQAPQGWVGGPQAVSAEPLKSDASHTSIPIPHELALELSAGVARWCPSGDKLAERPWSQTRSADRALSWAIERAMRVKRTTVEGLPSGCDPTTCDNVASPHIAAGLDLKAVQTRLRHASAMTTLNTYGHTPWPAAQGARRHRRFESCHPGLSPPTLSPPATWPLHSSAPSTATIGLTEQNCDLGWESGGSPQNLRSAPSPSNHHGHETPN